MIRFLPRAKDRRIIGLFYIVLSLFITAIAAGINVVVFPAILMENNISSSLIGFAAATEIISGFFAAILLSRALFKYGVVRSTLFLTALYSLILYCIFYYHNYLVWLLFEVLIGICWVSLYIVRQSWINNLISDKNRSIVIALSSSVFCVGFIIGSSIISFFGSLNQVCMIISSGLLLFSGLLILMVKDTAPKDEESSHMEFKELFKELPNETLARFLLDFMAGCVIFLGVVFGVRIGLTTEESGLLIAAFMTSGIFDLYAGFLAKYCNRAKLLFIGFLGSLISISLIFVFHESFSMVLTFFFLFGIFCALIIVVTLTNLNDKFIGSKLVAANSTFQAIGSMGSIIGCLAGGILMQIFDFYGFFIAIYLAIFTYIVYFSLFQAKNLYKNTKNIV